MTLKDLYFTNSAWDMNTMLTVKIRMSGQTWPTMKDTIVYLPKNVLMSEVICFRNDTVIVNDPNRKMEV